MAWLPFWPAPLAPPFPPFAEAPAICIVTFEPIVIVASAFMLIAPLVATVITPVASALIPPVLDVILTFLPWMITSPDDALIVMSLDDSIETVFSLVSRTTLFFLVESTTVTFSAPSVSSKMIRWPDFDLMTLISFLPFALVSGGSCFSFHSEPITIGRSTSPCSNTTST